MNKLVYFEKVKKVYRELAKKYHPDMNPNDEEAIAKFLETSEACEVLGNAEKKKINIKEYFAIHGQAERTISTSNTEKFLATFFARTIK